MNLVRIENVSPAIRSQFSEKVKQVANDLQINPNWLMQVMWAESRLNPQAVNRMSGASGLIQFMPDTARALGTTVEQIRNMSATQQLDLVRKYFWRHRGTMKSYYDVYSAVFFPALIGKPDNWTLQTSRLPASLIARQNPAVNINKDDKITVAEFKQYVYNTVRKMDRNAVFKAVGAGGAILLGLVLFFF